jgi:hypothetical protein
MYAFLTFRDLNMDCVEVSSFVLQVRKGFQTNVTLSSSESSECEMTKYGF